MSLIMILTLCSCGQEEVLLRKPFTMDAYKTYMNGTYYHSFPDKVFNTDELFNKLNAASGTGPVDVTVQRIEYIIKMVNGGDFSTFTIYNDHSVHLEYNFLFSSTFYLTEAEYQDIQELLNE